MVGQADGCAEKFGVESGAGGDLAGIWLVALGAVPSLSPVGDRSLASW